MPVLAPIRSFLQCPIKVPYRPPSLTDFQRNRQLVGPLPLIRKVGGNTQLNLMHAGYPFISLSIHSIHIVSLAILVADADVFFDIPETNLLRFGGLLDCDSETLATTVPSDPILCARRCVAEQRCRALLWNDIDRRCSQLRSPCKLATSSEVVTQLVKRYRPVHRKSWNFQGSRYVLTKKIGQFTEMQKVCARKGLYAWIPNNHEELNFVQESILNSLSSRYFLASKWSEMEILYRVWIGIVDKQNEGCLLLDYKTRCPVSKYDLGQPNGADEECVHYWKKNGSWFWHDNLCSAQFSLLCEGRRYWFS